MSRRPRPTRAALAVAWALIGVLGGHTVTYGLLFPDLHIQEEILAESGHAWLAIMPPAIVVALAVAIVLGLLTSSGRGGSRGVRFAALAAIQVSLFGSMELAERFASGMTLDTLAHQLIDHRLALILLVGALLQLVTAWLGSALSRAVAAVGRRMRAVSPRRRGAIPQLLPASVPVPAARPVRAHGSRGPPRRGASPALIP
jgi:hypothetical protein